MKYGNWSQNWCHYYYNINIKFDLNVSTKVKFIAND